MPQKQDIRSNYFFFAVAMGGALPYLAPYFQQLGVSNRDLGLILSLRFLVAVLALPFWNRVAGSSGSHARLAAVLAVASALFFPLTLIAPSMLWAAALIGVWSFFFSPFNSLSDTVAIRYLGEGNRNRFSRLRIFASLGFMTGVLVFGRLYDTIGIAWIFPVFSVAMIAASFFLRRIPADEDPLPVKEKGSYSILLRNRNIKVFLIAILLVEIGNQMGYSYLSVYAKSLSASNGQIGLLWSIATGCELVMMLYVPKIVGKVGVKTLLMWGMAAMVLRWTPFFLAGTWWHLIPVQMMQVFTIPFVYVGAVLFMDEEGPRSLRFTAQAFYSTIVLNVATIIGTTLGGFIAQKSGYPPLYLTAGLFALAGTLVFSLLICSKRGRFKRCS